MLIQCTSCGAQAKIPDSKEGAKVRCATCSHVYVARRPGAKAAKKDDPTKYFIIGGVVIAAAIIITIATGGDPPAPPVETEEVSLPPPVMVDELGWDSPAVKLTRDLHAAAVAQNSPKLLEAIDPPSAYADWRGRELAANAEAIEDAVAANENLGEGVEPTPVPEALAIPTWGELELIDRNLYLDQLVAGMQVVEPDNLLTTWRPFEGSVASMDEGTCIVHLKMMRLVDDDGTNRTMEWRLVDKRSDGSREPRWRVAGWGRYLSPEELAALRKKKHKKTTKRTLADGSFVIEGDIRAIPYEDDVPQAERDRIDELIRKRMDLDARPRVRTEANADLVAIGKPAIAPLLTTIHTAMPILTGPNDEARSTELMRLGLVHQTLFELTNYNTTFKPDESLGATKERIESGLKQWFGWYDRKYKKYDGKPSLADDPLMDDPDWQPRTERERQEFERIKRERAGG
ncbi:MAG: zinc-ribbon domain-containing protein [Planctomycetota bacterium]